MLKIDAKYVRQIENASSLSDLHFLFQKAIELEHSTIPPYLTAMYSLKPNTSKEQKEIIHSIVVEEMLHMTIAANILNALDGKPKINSKSFVPTYPGHLPLGIGGGLVVGIEAFSKELVKKVFMEIEEPEYPIEFKVMSAQVDTYKTIGEFYQALQTKIEELAENILPGNPDRQVTSRFFAPDLLYPIITKEDAISAIDIIVEQGEGTTTSPEDQFDQLAHYYRFEEIFVGKRLVKDPSAPNGYSFSGAEIPYNPTDVYPIFPNTKTDMLPVGSQERRRMNEFNASYYSLLDGLHRTFNGEPNFLDNSIGLMFDIKLYAEKLCATPFPGKVGYTIAPSFEYVSPEEFLLS
ncbi:ferritin-like protein [Arcicella aquatica]|uniref:Ferritin-like protein n=1 Tax=Arcicella aquatica TaxID=217141 RepID=A0ABU5QPT5_9BACT|nr:ferritin-like protein [Arcicella aquatica]MEA5259097.1 ferritin-like protein [Arcicella aquatica]